MSKVKPKKWMISRNGNNFVKKEFLEPMIKMDKICSYCLTEPNSGSDSAALATKAEKTNDGFKISEEDMKLRGYGDLLGFKQSGVQSFRLADPVLNEDLFFLAEKEVKLSLIHI